MPPTRTQRLVLLLDGDLERARALAKPIAMSGYTVRMRQHPTDLVQLGEADQAFVIVADLPTYLQGMAPGMAATLPAPVIFLASHDDLPTRLQALRAGGTAFLARPLPFDALLDKLHALTAVPPAEPYRVLIVDDQAAQARYAALALQHAGMRTEVVTDPLETLMRMERFRPDLVLLDLHMPLCSGPELAALIRQDDAYLSTPIVFLSGETDPQQQLSAMQLGGDEFVTKPIRPAHLIAVVQTRIRRLQTLQAAMLRDSLTGLLNHAALKERLASEVARARRSLTPLTFALLDLDHFKAVNDTHGHAVGDRVIKGLARMLQQRLRQTDSIGRSGGEEFAVILPGTDGAAGARLLERLRSRFAQLPHPSATGAFVTSFSCGVAELSAGMDALQLADAADQALYAAKARGRNQVVLAEVPGDGHGSAAH